MCTLLPLSSITCACAACLWTKWSEFIYLRTPFSKRTTVLLLFFVLSVFPTKLLSRPDPTDGRITPAVLLISPESFFPGWKHCHPFSLRCPPFPPFISVKWLPGGKLSSATICVRLARGRPAKTSPPPPPTCSSYPTIPPSVWLPSNALPSPFLPTLPTPVPAEGCGRAPSPSRRNFPVEIYINFRGLKFCPQRVKRPKLPSPFSQSLSIPSPSLPAFLSPFLWHTSPFLTLFSSNMYLSKFTFPFPSSLTTFFFCPP